MIYPLSAPLLDYLILSIVSRQDSYGYQISQQLKEVSSLKDSALYPVLRRLSENGFVETYDKQFQGRNRKYYRITKEGRAHCTDLGKEWKRHLSGLDRIILDPYGSGPFPTATVNLSTQAGII